MALRGYHLVNTAITLPQNGKILPLFALPLRASEKVGAWNPRISVTFSLFSKKSRRALKAIFPVPLSPFEAASSPDGSDLMLIEGNSS
ncbi:MAG TPA: hypothetical protein VJ762_00540 [Sphingobium sp.]|nr:hypothetical protein [Sphingobium sp.]